MATVPLFSQAQLERRVGATKLAQMLDFDGDGVADMAQVEEVIEEASSVALQLLLRVWPTEEAVALGVGEDPALQAYAIEIGAGVAGRRKSEFCNEKGEGPFDAWETRAVSRLEKFVSAHRRSKGEKEAGTHPLARTRANQVPTPFVFAASGNTTKAPGGF